MAAWHVVGAPVDGESCRTGTVARAVSTVAEVSGDWRAEMQIGVECGWVVRGFEANGWGWQCLALLQLGAAGDKGKGALTWGDEQNLVRQVRWWAARSAAIGVVRSEHWPGTRALDIPQVDLGPRPTGPDS
jgi:hypothetical protein